MDQNYISSLEETLKLVTVPDSATVKNASLKLSSEFYKESQALPALIQILQKNPDDQLKQLAAVELRKLVAKYWTDLDGSLKQEIRSTILQSTFNENSKLIRHSIARLVASIGELDLDQQQWPELLPSLVSGCTNQALQIKEMSVFILLSLLETGVSELGKHTSDILDLFAVTLNDNSSLEVRVTSLLLLDSVSTYIEEGEEINATLLQKYSALVPLMVNVLQNVLQELDTTAAKNVFNVFNNLLLVDNKLIGDQLISIINIMLEISVNKEVDEEFRVMALQFLISAVNYRKSKINASKFGPQLTLGALKIASEEIDVEDELNNEDEENENEENAPPSLALRLLAMLSLELPPSQVILPIFEQLPLLFGSANLFERRLALLSIGVTSSGAPDYFSTQLTKIIQLVVAGLKDAELIVRVASLRCILQLTSELQDTVAEYHAELLPLIIAIIDSATSVMVYKYATYALDGIIEFMNHDVIGDYLEPLMNKLFHMLDGAQSSSLKSAIVSAIGSTAYAAGKSFLPYFPNSIQYLQQFISLSTEGMTEDDIELRAVTFENISTMGRAVGSELFSQFAEPLIQALYESLSSDNSRLRESGFAFISNLAKVYGEGFAGFLDNIVPAIFTCLQQDEFQFNLDGDDEEDLDEEALENKFTVHTGITIEKEIASIALAELAVGTKKNFAKYVEQSIIVLKEQIDTSYGMREAALNALWKIVGAMFDASKGEDFKLPVGVQVGTYVDAEILSIIKEARKESITLLEEEFEVTMVGALLSNLSDYIKKLGSVAIIDNGDSADLEKMCVQLMLLLKKEHPCQLEADEMPSDEDTSETDAVIFDSTLEVLVHLSELLGGDFAKIFSSFKDIVVLQANAKSKVMRVSTVGALAEICNGMKEANPPLFAQEMLALFSDKLTNDKSLEVRGNAAYGVGVVIQYASTFDATPLYPAILQSLSKLLRKADKELLKNEDGDEETTDVINRSFANACGCVSRMALLHQEQVPLNAILPELLQHLPLEAAFEENTPIFKLVLKLYQDNNELILSQSAQVVKIFEGVFIKEFQREKLVSESTLGREENVDRLKQFGDDELKLNVVALLKHLETAYPGSVSSNEVLKTVI